MDLLFLDLKRAINSQNEYDFKMIYTELLNHMQSEIEATQMLIDEAESTTDLIWIDSQLTV